jgi:hypothetical protein
LPLDRQIIGSNALLLRLNLKRKQLPLTEHIFELCKLWVLANRIGSRRRVNG